jgi:hypothetical protein
MSESQIAEIRQLWDDEASQRLVGRKIVEARYLTRDEADGMAWLHSSVLLVLDDGTQLVPARDDEGNDAGALHGTDPRGQSFGLPVL